MPMDEPHRSFLLSQVLHTVFVTCVIAVMYGYLIYKCNLLLDAKRHPIPTHRAVVMGFAKISIAGACLVGHRFVKD